MLQWNYTDGKLMFKATCQTVGWCGVGFTESDDGKGMVNYDIVVGGYATGNGYLKVHPSKTLVLISSSVIVITHSLLSRQI